MIDPLALAAMAESGKRPLPCRLGFHKSVQFEQLITTGREVCVKCGTVANVSMFGDFDLSPSESASILRARAEQVSA